jgi:hypothetical protein
MSKRDKQIMPVDFLPIILLFVFCAAVITCFRSKRGTHPQWRPVFIGGIAVPLILFAIIYIWPGLRAMRSARHGDVHGEFELAKWYESGFNTGLFSLSRSAAVHFENAAEQGHSLSQFQMGTLYAHGTGVLRDYDKAVLWYEKAKANGLPEAQRSIDWVRKLQAAQQRKTIPN